MGKELGAGKRSQGLFFFFFFNVCVNCLGCKSGRILVPQTKEPGIKPVPLAVEAQNFKH